MEKDFVWAIAHLLCIIIGVMCCTMGNVVGGGIVIGINTIALIVRVINLITY